MDFTKNNNIVKLIGLTERCLVMYRQLEFKEYNLGSCHHSYLFFINRNNGVYQDVVSKNLHINKSNVTRNIQYLEKEGYIYREVCKDDKRKYRLYLTQKARDILPLIRNKIRQMNEELVVGLSDDELTLFISLLSKICVNACNFIDNKYMVGDIDENNN